MSVTERVVIVTGAAQGIGLATAEEFLGKGYKVVMVDKNKEKLDAYQSEQTAFDKESILCLETDVADVAAIRKCINAVLNQWGRIDVLVNNAAIRTETSISDMTVEEWDKVLKVNLGGTFFFSQAVLESMKKQQWGRIINLSSFAGQFGPLTSGAHYSAAKAGQITLGKIFARELASDHITVNSIAPAAIQTPEMDKIDPVKLEKMTQSIPVGRIGTSQEVAKIATYLASEEAGFITGSTIDINGGMLMR